MVRKATDNSLQWKIPYLHNKILALNNIPNSWDKGVSNNTNTYPPREVFNIQLLYDIN